MAEGRERLGGGEGRAGLSGSWLSFHAICMSAEVFMWLIVKWMSMNFAQKQQKNKDGF